MKIRYIYDKETGTGEWINPREIKIERQRQKSAQIREDIVDLKSPITGEHFSSLRKYQAHVKDHGYEITHGDHFTGKGIADVSYENIVNQAEMTHEAKIELNRARWGMMPCTDREKQLWTEEKRMERGESNNLTYLKEKGLKEYSQKTGVPMSELKRKMSY